MIQALPATNNSGCSGQGRWTNISIALPASAIGNANVKIGFEWTNNDDGVGTDPSVAIDDLVLSVSLGINSPEITDVKVSYDPATDLIYVNTGIENDCSITVGLFSIEGKQVLSQQLNSSQHMLSVSTLEPGVYLLELTGEGKNFLPVKLVIE